MRSKRYGCLIGLAASFFFSYLPLAVAETTGSKVASEANPRRWMLLLCGLAGEEEHQERFAKALEQIYYGSMQVLQVPSNQIVVSVGDETMKKDLVEGLRKERSIELDPRSVAISTKESIANIAKELGSKLEKNDELFVIVIGHTHLEGSQSQWNIDGPDIDQTMFASIMTNLEKPNKVFWLTQSASGFWMRPLAGPGQVVITATEAADEITSTEMPVALGSLFVGDGQHAKIEDFDKDGKLSLLDLYIAACVETNQMFLVDDWLPTEHAQIDDNGDGRGTEVQEPYLPIKPEVDADGKPVEPSPRPAPPAITPKTDGFASQMIRIQAP